MSVFYLNFFANKNVTQLTLFGSECDSCTFHLDNSTACPELVHLLKNNVKPVTIEESEDKR